MPASASTTVSGHVETPFGTTWHPQHSLLISIYWRKPSTHWCEDLVLDVVLLVLGLLTHLWSSLESYQFQSTIFDLCITLITLKAGMRKKRSCTATGLQVLLARHDLVSDAQQASGLIQRTVLHAVTVNGNKQ